MEFVGYGLLLAGMLLGLGVIPFGLPGAAVILVCVFIYALLTNFSAGVNIPFFVFLCILTLIAETADNWLTAIGARRYGASRAAMWLSVLGGVGGAILIGSPLIVAFGPLGPVAGGLVGAFSVVVLYEYYHRRNVREALRAGWGTFLGRMAGMVLKFVIGVAMILAALSAIILYGTG
jgi:uncharacterized protein YqgC (DUF456 family)